MNNPGNSPVSIFDLDDTLLRGNSSFLFSRYLTRHGVYPFWAPFAFVWYKWQFQSHLLGLRELHDRVHENFVRGQDIGQLRALANAYFDEELGKLLQPKVLNRFVQVKEEGHHTILLSSTPQYLVEIIGNRLGFHLSKGTEYHEEPEGKISDISSLIDGKAKADFASSLPVAKEKITAYTDSIHDLPLLNVVGVPIAVNPDKKLKKICIEQQWQIL